MKVKLDCDVPYFLYIQFLCSAYFALHTCRRRDKLAFSNIEFELLAAF